MPDVVHRGSCAGSVYAAALVHLALERALEDVEQLGGYLVNPIDVLSELLCLFAKFLVQRLMTLKVMFDGIDNLAGRDSFLFEVVLLQGSQGIDRRGNTRSVEAEVVVLTAQRCVLRPFDATVHHQRHHRCRHDVEVVLLGTKFIYACLNLQLNT